MSAQPLHPLDRLLEEVIAEEGGTCRSSEIRAEVVAIIERMTAEQTTGPEIAPFCHWVVAGGVGVFTFIGDEFEVYVVSCPANRQWELVNRFDRIARTDVAAFKARLHARYGKEQADLVIKPDLAYDWLYGDAEHETAGDGEPMVETERTAEAEGTAGESLTGKPALLTSEAAEPAESEPTFNGDPMLEEMMAAIRAAGGGKGRKPFRITDLG